MKTTTIKEMTMEMMLDAAAKNRKEMNFADSMYICENMSRFFYRWYIVDEYRKFIGGKDSREILESLAKNLHYRQLAASREMSKRICEAAL